MTIGPSNYHLPIDGFNGRECFEWCIIPRSCWWTWVFAIGILLIGNFSTSFTFSTEPGPKWCVDWSPAYVSIIGRQMRPYHSPKMARIWKPRTKSSRQGPEEGVADQLFHVSLHLPEVSLSWDEARKIVPGHYRWAQLKLARRFGVLRGSNTLYTLYTLNTL